MTLPKPIIDICKKCSKLYAINYFDKHPNDWDRSEWYCKLRPGATEEEIEDDYKNYIYKTVPNSVTKTELILGPMKEIPNNCLFSIEHLYLDDIVE